MSNLNREKVKEGWENTVMSKVLIYSLIKSLIHSSLLEPYYIFHPIHRYMGMTHLLTLTHLDISLAGLVLYLLNQKDLTCSDEI